MKTISVLFSLIAFAALAMCVQTVGAVVMVVVLAVVAAGVVAMIVCPLAVMLRDLALALYRAAVLAIKAVNHGE